MTAALLRVSVVSGARRVDLAVPPSLPVAEIVPGVARRLGVVAHDGLRLSTAAGSALVDSAGLATQEVPDGAVLTLAPPPPPPLVHDDPAEVLTGANPPGGPPRWTPAAGAAVLLLMGALTLAVAGDARGAAVVALLLLAGGLGLGGAAPGPAVVSCASASAYAAVAAGLLARGLRPGAGPLAGAGSAAGAVWAASGGAALAVAALGMAGLRTHRLRLLPVLVVGSTCALVGAVLSLHTVPGTVLACVLLVVGVLLSAALPWLVVGRISRPRGRVDPARLADEAGIARALLLGLAVGLGAVQVALTAVVARHGQGGVALAGCAAAISLLRSRHHSAQAEALVGVLAGGLGTVVTVAVALWMHAAWRGPGALALAAAGGALLVVPLLRRDPEGRGGGPVTRSLLQAGEAASLVALLPLAVIASGLTQVVR